MKNSSVYVPKAGDVVFVGNNNSVRYAVVDVDHKKQSARVKNVKGVASVLQTESWSNLHHLDESQTALRVVREATED
jgi:hypothetical protein